MSRTRKRPSDVRPLALFLSLLLAGCGSTGSGFLDADVYAKLKPGEKKGSRMWIRKGADLRAYDLLLIEPIVCMPMKKESEDLTPELKKKATETFHDILVAKVDPFYPVVDRPGPHVLRVRIALTELTPSKKDMGVGAAALEVDFRDSQTNEVLCAATSRIQGSREGSPESGEWQAVVGAFHEWAERLLEFMDSHHEE